MTETSESMAKTSLKSGWTTGACAAAGAKAAALGLACGVIPSKIEIRLPRGQLPVFDIVDASLSDHHATAGVIKDAGDDPDVTHGALVSTHVSLRADDGLGIRFHAGAGVGTVTRPGLPLEVGEPAINPAPRKLITECLNDVRETTGLAADLDVTISIPGGDTIALKTANPRLGILGGLSILGTTGVVTPYSCAAWIHSIHRGVDVARAAGWNRIAAATGSTSEQTLKEHFGFSDSEIIEMGDFAGGLLKYLRKNPVEQLLIAGGFAKLVKLGQGASDLHSRRSQVDFSSLSELMAELGADDALIEQTRSANTALEVLRLAQTAGIPLAQSVANRAADVATQMARDRVAVDVATIDRAGVCLAMSS